MKKFFLLLTCFFVINCVALISQDSKPLWLRYPSISPDGKSIAFCFKGDIYIVDSKGGQARVLTLAEGHDFMPVWSNDSKNIAFASDRTGNYDIYLVPAQGGTAKRLTFNSNSDVPDCFSADGSKIYFSSMRNKSQKSLQFNGGRIPELYSVPIIGGMEKQEMSVGIEEAKFNKAGTQFLFQDKKGYEDPFRKHHKSSVTRDLWIYDIASNKFDKLTDFNGEDRNPVWSGDEKSMYYLSEKSGSFNVWKMDLNNKSNNEQITKFDKNPVRFLSSSNDETLCFTYDGEIYSKSKNGEATKVAIQINIDERYNQVKNEVFTNGATELAVSPNGKEVVYVIRGEVFVTSLEGTTTKRITNTPTQERNVSFSTDGRSILYAAEKNNVWGIYETSLTRAEEKFFYNSTVLKESEILDYSDTKDKGTTGTIKEVFQPKYSPDGLEVAFIEERTAIKVINIKSKEVREILPADKNYSYSDGDQWFEWSPDGKYLMVQFLIDNNWTSQIGIIDASGKGKLINLTNSGYDNSNGKWMNKGNMMIYFTNRDGMKNHGGHGWQSDVYAMFFNQEAFDKYKINKEDYAMLKDDEKNKKDRPEDKDKEKAEAKKDEKKTKKLPEVIIDTNNLSDRKVRLTIHSAEMADAIMSSDGEQLYYLARFEKGFDLWVNKLRDKETKLLLKLGANSVSSLEMDEEGKNLFLVADGRMMKINPEKPESKDIGIRAEMQLDQASERNYMFEHAWRQAYKKFYVTNMQGVDWQYYHDVYKKFLPYINNNRDFAELLSEMLGELNASHTGGRYGGRFVNPDETAALGLFFDESYTGNGLKISEVIDKSPFTKANSKVKVGNIIEKIDGIELNNENNLNKLLNRKVGMNTLFSLYDPTNDKRWEETAKPINQGEQGELLYQRWIKKMQNETEKLSGGRLGYVHVRGMDNGSFRVVYDQAMGKYANKEALIVDTRNNGGGWLHDDLATFLSGKKYIEFIPREHHIGDEPQSKWNKPSIVLMCEGNYSDAHMFPYTYKALNIGKLVGMPVPGTGTAVWWETMQDPTMVFGIPEVGVKGLDGKYLENQELQPDIMIKNDFNTLSDGRDQQLEAAVEELLKELGGKK